MKLKKRTLLRNKEKINYPYNAIRKEEGQHSVRIQLYLINQFYSHDNFMCLD